MPPPAVKEVVNCATHVTHIMLATQTISHQVDYVTRQLVP